MKKKYRCRNCAYHGYIDGLWPACMLEWPVVLIEGELYPDKDFGMKCVCISREKSIESGIHYWIKFHESAKNATGNPSLSFSEMWRIVKQKLSDAGSKYVDKSKGA